jgi:anti-sigma regulatory factor (Ser/Thr protein kinase)
MSTLACAAPADGWQLDLAQCVLPASEASAPASRRLAGSWLAAWPDLARLAPEVQVVTTELVTNAVRASRQAGGRTILLRVVRCRGAALVVVGDRHWRPPPRPPRTAESAIAGRGLAIVGSLSWLMAWYAEDRWKLVWAAVGACGCGAGERCGDCWPGVDELAAPPLCPSRRELAALGVR